MWCCGVSPGFFELGSLVQALGLGFEDSDRIVPGNVWWMRGWTCAGECVPVPLQAGGAVGPEPRQQGLVGVLEDFLGATLSLEVTEQERQFSDTHVQK